MGFYRTILIGGTSHIGKSTLAKALATKLGWTAISTDSLARHPGRPWRQNDEKIPNHVAEYYLTLSVDELIKDVLQHYRVGVSPKVEAILKSQEGDSGPGLILEGSALWPEFVTALNFNNIAALWLSAESSVIRQRM